MIQKTLKQVQYQTILPLYTQAISYLIILKKEAISYLNEHHIMIKKTRQDQFMCDSEAI